MNRAESVMDEFPDSALGILETLDSTQTSGLSKKDAARYALLLNMAINKCDSFPENDSTIKIAINYYTAKGDVRNRMLSQYYLGELRRHEERNAESLAAYMLTHADAVELSDNFWIAMAYRGMSDIYCGTYNGADELIYAKEALKYFRLANKPLHADYAMLDLASAYNNIGDYSTAYKIAKKVHGKAIETDNDDLLHETSQLMGNYLMNTRKYPEMAELYKDVINSRYATTSDSLKLVIAYAYLHREDSAQTIFSKIHGSDFESDIWTSLYYRLTAETNGDFRQAFLYEIQFANNAEKLLTQRINSNVSSSSIEYLQLANINKNAAIKEQRLKIACLIILILLILTIAGFFSYRASQKHRMLRQENLQLAEQLERIIEDHNSETAESATEIEETKSHLLQSAEIIRDLLADQYYMLEEMRIVYLNDKSDTRKIADAIDNIIGKISIHGDRITELENRIDRIYDNLITDFKADLPDLKEQDLLIFIYSVCGMSNNFMRFLLKEKTVSGIYNRKRHLKDKIKRLDEAKAARYMQFFK